MAAKNIPLKAFAPPGLSKLSAAVRKAFWTKLGAFALALKRKEVLAGIDIHGKKLAKVKPSSRPDGADGEALDPHYDRSRTYKLLSAHATSSGATLSWPKRWTEILGYHADGMVPGAPVRDTIGISPDGRKKLKAEAPALLAMVQPVKTSVPSGPMAGPGLIDLDALVDQPFPAKATPNPAPSNAAPKPAKVKPAKVPKVSNAALKAAGAAAIAPTKPARVKAATPRAAYAHAGAPGAAPPPKPAPPPRPIKLPPAIAAEDLRKIDLHQVEPSWALPPNPGKLSYGGVLFNEHGQVLLREPSGHFGGYHWTFPKGKAEGTDHPIDTALREVLEETGHKGAALGLVPGGFQGDTGRSYFFVMKSTGQDPSQMDSETASTKWVSIAEAKALIGQTTNAKGRARDLDILDAASKHFQELQKNPKANDHLKAAIKEAKAKPVEPPKPATKFTPDGWPADPHSLEVVKALGGSTGAELVKDSNGKLYVRKQGANKGHLLEEGHADAAYRALGADVPASKVFDHPTKPTKLSEFIEGKALGELQRSDPGAAAAAEAKLQEHFVLDAILGNWDVIGMNADNVLVGKDGKVYRIDNGGSLRYRAQGALKSAAQWNGTLKELDSLRDASVNPVTAKVFGPLTEANIKAQAAKILAKRKELLAALPADLRQTVGERLDALQARIAPPKVYKAFTPHDKDVSAAQVLEMEKFGKDHWTGWKAGLTKDQKSAIRDYKGSDYTTINNHLRTGSTAGPGIKKKVEAIDAALNQAHTPEDLSLWRGVKDLSRMGLSGIRSMVGADWTDKGFVSISLNKKASEHFLHGGEPAMFRIKVPKGTPAGYLDVLSDMGEYELLFHRGTKFRITAVGEYNPPGSPRRIPLVDVELIPSPLAQVKP